MLNLPKDLRATRVSSVCPNDTQLTLVIARRGPAGRGARDHLDRFLPVPDRISKVTKTALPDHKFHLAAVIEPYFFVIAFCETGLIFRP
jgi:hypothetical protein